MMLNRRRFDELTPEADLNESGAGVDQKVLLISFKISFFFFKFLKKPNLFLERNEHFSCANNLLMRYKCGMRLQMK